MTLTYIMWRVIRSHERRCKATERPSVGHYYCTVTVGLQTASQDLFGQTYPELLIWHLYSRGPKNNAYYLGHVITSLWRWWYALLTDVVDILRSILSLEIYTNIVINFHNHNTCCYFISAALFCISVYFIIATLLVVACILHKWN